MQDKTLIESVRALFKLVANIQRRELATQLRLEALEANAPTSHGGNWHDGVIRRLFEEEAHKSEAMMVDKLKTWRGALTEEDKDLAVGEAVRIMGGNG